MKYILPILFIVFAVGCSPKPSPKKSKGEKVSVKQPVRYYYQMLQPANAYEDSSITSRRLPSLVKGDTISTLFNRIDISKWQAVEKAGYRFFIYRPSLYALYTEQLDKNYIPAYRPISTLPNYKALSPQEVLQAERITPRATVENKYNVDRSELSKKDITRGLGIGFGFSSQKVLFFDLNYTFNRHMFHAGYGFQFNGQLGRLVSEQKSNYGTSIIGSGQRLQLFTTEYDYWLSKRLSIGVDGAIGGDVYYTNYSDQRFNGGGYHMDNGAEFAAGIGGKFQYKLSNWSLIGAGYNTLTGINISIALCAVNPNW